MGRVAATYNLMPEGTEVPIESIQEAVPKVIPEGITVAKMEIKPVAFGLKMVELSCVMDDAEGLINKLEDALATIEGVQNVETVSVSLL